MSGQPPPVKIGTIWYQPGDSPSKPHGYRIEFVNGNMVQGWRTLATAARAAEAGIEGILRDDRGSVDRRGAVIAAIEDVLEICSGWTRPMRDDQKVDAIETIMSRALEREVRFDTTKEAP